MKTLIGAISIAAVVAASSLLTGCGATQPSTAVTGAGIGALGGYVAGRATGSHSDERARKGAIAGAIGGYVVGNEVEKSRRNNQGYNAPAPANTGGYYHQHPGSNVRHTHANGVVHAH